MARPFDKIKDVTDAKELWKFSVRVEDVWKSGTGKNEHIEFLIIDKQGDNIQVVLTPELSLKWKDKFHEGSTYVMENFRVKHNDLKVKFTYHKWTLTMVGGGGASDIVPQQIKDLPYNKFNFKSFEDIKNGKYRDDLLVDIIGAVHEVAPTKVNSGNKKLPTSFTLADGSMNIITCTLWDKFGAQFLENYNKNLTQGPVIVIIKHGKIKEPDQGGFDLAISNAWSGTKLIMDPKIAEMKDFIKKLPKEFDTQIQTQLAAEGSKFNSQNSQGSQYSTAARYAYQAPATHLSKFVMLPQDTVVTTIATAVKIKISSWGWSYLACKDCKKAIVSETQTWKCKLNHVTESPQLKYKIELEMKYGSDSFTFLFWDRECTQLIGNTADELKEIMINETGEFDPHEYPVHLDKLLAKELAFKVCIQSTKVAGVLNYRDDPEIIANLKEQLLSENANEGASKIPLVPQIIGEESKSNVPSANETIEEESFATQDLSATAESSRQLMKMQTPAKRPGKDVMIDEQTPGNLSSNKLLKNIKIEGDPKSM